MKAFLLFFLVLLISGCSTLKTGSGSSYVTLEACNGPSSCETSFLVHSSTEEWVEQLVFEADMPLINAGVLKNTRAGARPFLGVGFNTEYPMLVFVPIGQKVDGVPMKITIIHETHHTIKLRLKSPLSISVEEPTR